MKIIHVNASDLSGSGIAAMRLNHALTVAGVDSSLLVSRKTRGDALTVPLLGFAEKTARARVSGVYWAMRSLGLYQDGLRSLNVLPTGLHKRLNASDADIIHLHWVNSEMISISELAKIKKPVVWTLHDMWPFCGAEHYTTRTRYVTGYSKVGRGKLNVECEENSTDNQQLTTNNRRPLVDLDRWVFHRKQKHWTGWIPHIVTPSNWLANCARQSVLFKDLSVDVIPNCLDLDVFEAMDQKVARKRFDLPLDKKLILFGAFNPSDERKGGDLLEEALKHIECDGVELIVFGASAGADIAGIKTHWVGSLSQEADLAQLYSAVDLFVASSRQDNLPNTVAESISCGAPVVAFNIGGIPDMVEHKHNGYLAQPFDVEDLARGVEWVLSGASRGDNARKKAEELFDETRVASAYLKVYQNLVSA